MSHHALHNQGTKTHKKQKKLFNENAMKHMDVFKIDRSQPKLQYVFEEKHKDVELTCSSKASKAKGSFESISFESILEKQKRKNIVHTYIL